MKKLYIIVAFLLVSSGIFAQLNEGFEGTTFPPLGWTVVNGGDTNTWVRYTTTPHTGLACAAITYGSTAHADYLITPQIAITPSDNTLNAWFKSQSATYPEPYDVMVSTTSPTDTANFTLLAAESDPGTTWIQRTYNLSAYNGQNIYIVFRSTTTDMWRLYIDDIAIIHTPANDVGITTINAPSAAILPGSVIPQVTVKNFGTATQTNIPVYYKIGSSGNVVSTTIASLAAGVSTNISFPAWTATNGNYNFIFYTGLALDSVMLNDTMQINIVVTPVLTPIYCFKGGDQPSKFYLEAPNAGFVNLGSAKPWASRGGAFVANATVKKWFVLGSNFNLYSMDTLTGDTTLVGSVGVSPDFLSGLTYDKLSNTLYASGLTGTYPAFTFSLYTINQTTGAATLVANSPSTGTFFELACNDAGQLFVIEHQETGNGKLYSVNKTTAALTLIGTDLGVPISANFQDIDFAPNGNLYFSASNGTTVGDADGFYSINTTTGIATLVNVFPVTNTQVTGLAIPYTLFDGATITFNVSNGTNPIAGANVKIYNNNLATNSLGTTSIYLPVGSYADTISAFGYVNGLGNVTVVNGINQTIPIVLNAATTYTATFTVQSNTSTLLSGAAIVVKIGNYTYNGTTNSSGIYAFNLPAGVYNYTVTLANYSSQTGTFTITSTNLPISVTLSSCTVSTFPWTESFEDTTSFGCFTKASPDGGSGWAHIASGATPLPGWNGGTMTTPTSGGTKAVYCTWNTGGAASNDQWLITPQIAVQNNKELSFYLFWFGHYKDNLDIKVSTTTNATSSFNTTLLSMDTTQFIQGDWKLFTISLSNYAGQNIYIAFNEHITDNQTDGAFIGLDMVKIETATGINESIESLTSIYPNPVKNELNITSVSALKNVKIINALGQEIVNEKVSGNHYKINTSSYIKGIYFVQIESEKGKTTNKFVVSE